MFEKTKAFCDSFLEKGLPGFDLVVYKDGECVLRYANGYSDVENKIKMTGKERFNIYSCSKPITCTAALQLFDKGLFSLDDNISDYMPEFKEMTVKTEDGVKKAEKDITIRDLFGMSSGLSYNVTSHDILKYKEDTNGRCPTRETMKYIARKQTKRNAGASDPSERDIMPARSIITAKSATKKSMRAKLSTLLPLMSLITKAMVTKIVSPARAMVGINGMRNAMHITPNSGTDRTR